MCTAVTGRDQGTVQRMDWGERTKEVFVDYFLGGEARVSQFTSFFEALRGQGRAAGLGAWIACHAVHNKVY